MVKRYIFVFFIFYCFLSLGLQIFLDYYYINYMPKIPIPSLGEIYPLDIHGAVVYINYKQHFLLKFLFWSMLLSGFIGVYLKKNQIKNKKG